MITYCVSTDNSFSFAVQPIFRPVDLYNKGHTILLHDIPARDGRLMQSEFPETELLGLMVSLSNPFAQSIT